MLYGCKLSMPWFSTSRRGRRYKETDLEFVSSSSNSPLIATRRLRSAVRRQDGFATLVRDHALRLTYTANDMAPFARDLGFDGPPFIWDEEERRHLRARIDALYFHLYGLPREDASYVLDTFPIVRRNDEASFGKYRTKEMILAYMNALAAGDTDTVVGGIDSRQGTPSWRSCRRVSGSKPSGRSRSGCIRIPFRRPPLRILSPSRASQLPHRALRALCGD